MYRAALELGREVSVTRTAPGSVKRLSLAVVLRDTPGKKRTPVEMQQIEALVRGAVGFDAARGDVVTVSARPFVADPVVAPAWYENAWIPVAARYLGALLALAAGWFVIGRPLLKRYNATTESIKRAELGALISQEIDASPTKIEAAPVTLDMIEAAPGYNTRAALVRDFVKQDPARAAMVLRDMIRAEPAGADRE